MSFRSPSGLVALATLAAIVASVHAAPDERPNVVVIVSDDHRADVLGCAGHPVVLTPNLDDLARDGVRFEEAFVTTSICAASRASILTGLVERTHRYTFGTPPLAAEHCALSYPTLLREAGYRTGFVGKLGVNVDGGRATIGRLFDDFVPLSRSPYLKVLADGSTRHVTDLTGDAAVEFIRTNATAGPFCLSVSFNAGHAEDGDLEQHFPYPESEADLYAGVPMPRPRLDDDSARTHPPFLADSMNTDRYGWRWDTPAKYERNLRNYFRMLSGLDRNIGRIVTALETSGVRDRTVIVFIGDNGYYMGERGFAGKWTHYDESLRVPLIVFDPRAPEASRGRTVTPIALNIDVAPTALAAAGLAIPSSMQGRSLLPFAGAGDVVDDRDGFFCEHLMKHARIPRWEGYRTRTHLFARYMDADHEFFHALETDPDALENIVGQREHRKTLQTLRATTRTLADLYDRGGTALPRVLLLGDSISMGYHQHVVDALLGAMRVVRPAENCAGTTKGVAKIDAWLAIDGGRFDTIHFNFGLHDLKRVKPDGRNSTDPGDARQADLEQYEANLQAIVATLQATGARLVFATTTPVPPGGVRPHRDVEDPARYNAAARRVMAEHGIPVNDLNALVGDRVDELMRPVDVHFTREGSRVLAAEVVRALRSTASN